MNKVTKWLVLGIVFVLLIGVIMSLIGSSIELFFKLTIIGIICVLLYKAYNSTIVKKLLIKFKIKKK